VLFYSSHLSNRPLFEWLLSGEGGEGVLISFRTREGDELNVICQIVISHPLRMRITVGKESALAKKHCCSVESCVFKSLNGTFCSEHFV